MTDIYQPPDSDVDVAIADDRRGIPWKGLLIGLVIEFSGSVLVGMVIIIGHSLLLMLFNMPTEEVLDVWTDYEFYSLTSFILHGAGFLMTFIGAYFCVRIINFKLYHYAAVFAVLSSIIGVLFDMGEFYTIEQHLLLITITFAVSLSAAWVHGYRRSQKRA